MFDAFICNFSIRNLSFMIPNLLIIHDLLHPKEINE